jgi:site-specific recombinase XerD
MDTAKDQIALPHFIDEYLSHLAQKPRTQRTYRAGLARFQDFLLQRKVRSAARRKYETTALLRLSDLEESVLIEFNDWLSKYSKFTRNTYLAAVVMFLSYAIFKTWLPTFSLERAKAQFKHMRKDKKSYPVPRIDPGLPKIVEYWDSKPLPDGDSEKARRQRLIILRARAFVHLLYGSAARLEELRMLDIKEIGRGRKSEAIIQGKGDKERFIFITPDAKATLRTYLDARNDQYEPVFISHHRDYGARANASVLRRIVYQAAEALGIDASPHDFRHYRASQMLQQGAPLEAIQEILGHSDIGTTRRVYAHYSKPSIRSIFERTTLSPQDAARAADTLEVEGEE